MSTAIVAYLAAAGGFTLGLLVAGSVCATARATLESELTRERQRAEDAERELLLLLAEGVGPEDTAAH
jgi:hypothetical protein